MALSSHLMALQTANALLIIRSFTKYIIEIENESALLEQLNARPSTSSQASNESQSPQRLLKDLTLRPKLDRDDSQEQADSGGSGEADSVNNFQLQRTEGDENEPLYMLITNILQLCIQVPVE